MSAIHVVAGGLKALLCIPRAAVSLQVQVVEAIAEKAAGFHIYPPVGIEK
jgi:hypothetical protein